MNRINIVCLGVTDMEKSLSFYKNIGFKTYETNGKAPVVFFPIRGASLSFSLWGSWQGISMRTIRLHYQVAVLKVLRLHAI